MMKKARNGHRWTTEEMKAFATLWTDGEPLVEIAKVFGVTERAINHLVVRLRKSGIPLPYRKQGHKPDRYNKLWSHAEVEYVIRRRNDGATAEQIAAETGRTFYGVQGIIQSMRTKGVAVPMLGQGTRRLWDAEALKAFCSTGIVDNANEPRR
jgi:biotin operon repressor